MIEEEADLGPVEAEGFDIPEDDPMFSAPLKPTFVSVCSRLTLFHSVVAGAPTVLPDYFASDLSRDAGLLAIRLSRQGFRFPPIVPYPEDPVGHFDDMSRYLEKIAPHIPEQDFRN